MDRWAHIWSSIVWRRRIETPSNSARCRERRWAGPARSTWKSRLRTGSPCASRWVAAPSWCSRPKYEFESVAAGNRDAQTNSTNPLLALRPRDRLRHVVLAFRRCGGESGTRAFLIGGVAVLAELVAADQRFDAQFDADDVAHLRTHVIVGRIADVPTVFGSRFVAVGELDKQFVQARFVVERHELAARFHREVVPGRHLARIVLLAGIPRRRHVGVRPLEHDQRVGTFGRNLPLRVVAREMAHERAVRAT